MASTGEAAEIQSARMGIYTIQSANHNYNNRPTYKHVEGNQFLFYNDLGSWIIWSVPSGTTGGIMTVKPGLLHIPAEGWKYWDDKWDYDSLLTVSSYEGIFNSIDCPSFSLSLICS